MTTVIISKADTKNIYAIRNKMLELHNHQMELMVQYRDILESGKMEYDPPIYDFDTVERIPKALREYFELDKKKMTFHDLILRIFKYLKQNKMYDKKNPHIIQTDSKLRKIFGMRKNDTLTCYNIQTYLRNLFEID